MSQDEHHSASTRRVRWRGELVEARAPTDVALRFAAARGAVRSVVLAVVRPPVDEDEPSVTRLALERAVPPGAAPEDCLAWRVGPGVLAGAKLEFPDGGRLTVQLEVEAVGELPLLERIVLRVEGKTEETLERLRERFRFGLGFLPPGTEDPGPGPDEHLSAPVEFVEPEGFDAFLSASVVTPTQLLAARAEALCIDHALARFFLEFDARTTLEPTARAEEQAELLRHLEDFRLRRRRLAAHSSREAPDALVPPFRVAFEPLDPSDPSNARVHAFAGHVSELLASLVGVHLTRADGDLVDHAFTAFVTNRLAVQHPDPALHGLLSNHGTPDSTLYLMFAELGLMCLGEGLSVAFWERHLETFVRTAQIALELAAPPGAGHGVFDLPPADFVFGRGRAYPDGRIAELRAEYRLLFAVETAEGPVWDLDGLEERYASIVGRAFTLPSGSLADTDEALAAMATGREIAAPVELRERGLSPPTP